MQPSSMPMLLLRIKPRPSSLPEASMPKPTSPTLDLERRLCQQLRDCARRVRVRLGRRLAIVSGLHPHGMVRDPGGG